MKKKNIGQYPVCRGSIVAACKKNTDLAPVRFRPVSAAALVADSMRSWQAG